MPKKKSAPEPIAVTVKAERIGERLKVTATHGDKLLHVDTLNLDSASQRGRFIKAIGERLAGVDADALQRDLLSLPATVPAELPNVDAEPATAAELVNVRIVMRPNNELIAEHDGSILHLDKIDISKAQHRKRFIGELQVKLPALDAVDAEKQLLSIAEQIAQEQAKPAASGGADEADVLNVVRPEIFHTSEVSGIAVPARMVVNGKPGAQWRLYLRWRDGRRECRLLAASLDLPESRRLWLNPIPGEPSMNTAAGWSSASRRGWLSDSTAPNPAILFREICESIAQFIDFPPDTAPGTSATVALWIFLSYCYPLFEAVPYLSIGGPMGSGKSRVLDILGRLVFRPLSSSNLTGPALFRTLHDRGGVVLYDEAERLRQSTPDVQELLSMLLAGYRRGGTAMRLEAVGDSFRPIQFDVFGPKAIAGIAGLSPTLASRCIPLVMFRAGPDSPKPRRRLDETPARWEYLRDGLHALALDSGTAWLELPQRQDVVPDAIGGRDYELWQPLLALAEWVELSGAQGLLSLMQRHALVSVASAKDDAVPEADETLLEILAEAIRNNERPAPSDLLERAQKKDCATFGKWGPRGVSNRLAVYGLRADKFNGRREFRPTMTDLAKIQLHYGIDLGVTLAPNPNDAPLSSLAPLMKETPLFSCDWSGTKNDRDARGARDEEKVVRG